MGCGKPALDLSKIDFNQPASKYLENLSFSGAKVQHGHWELFRKAGTADDVELKLSDNGEVSTVYDLIEASDKKKVNFFNYSPIEGMGVEIVEYKNKIAFYSMYLDETKTSEALLKLKEKLGKPIHMVLDTIGKSSPFLPAIIKTFPSDDVKSFKDEFGDDKLSYPVHYIWKKENTLYQFTLLVGKTLITSKIVAIDINAFKDKIIFGYHRPSQDPILGKYLN